MTDKLVWTAAYLGRDDGAILVRERGPTVMDAGMYGPPGGKVERGESIIQGLVREVREETGIVVADPFSCRLLEIYDCPHGVCFLYRVPSWTEPMHGLLVESGHGPWRWMQPADLVGERVQCGLARWLGQHAFGCRPMLQDARR